MDERMLSRNLARFQNDAVRVAPPERRTAVKRMALAIGGLQPGFVLFGCIHDSMSYQKSCSKQSISEGEASFFRQTQDKLPLTRADSKKHREACSERAEASSPSSFELSSASNPGYIKDVTEQRSGDVAEATLRDLVSGQKLFGRYTLIKILGRGGMGVVWLARDEELEREGAVKFLRDLVVRDGALVSELKRETRRGRELTHKNIVRIHDFVFNETSGCISMEYVDGDTLSNLRSEKDQKVFEPNEIANWTSQLCDALDYAHNQARIVHRDLKPANLMVNRSGDLKVSDFGIARNLGDTASRLTMEQGRSGTLVYMSPQQLDGERGTHLDDIYSLGATLYDLLTSKPPFYSGNIDRQIHERSAPSMTERRRDLNIEPALVPQVWEDAVAACLAKDPTQRPQSAAEVAQRLQLSSPQTRAVPSVLIKRPKKKLAFAAGIAAVCVLAIAGSYFGLLKKSFATAAPSSAALRLPVTSEESIAVLPFENRR